MRRAFVSAAGLIALAGCQADQFRFDPVPIDGSIQSVVVVLVQGTEVTATAYAPQQTNALRLPIGDIDLAERVTVWALGYETPLDELSLKSGPQTLASWCLPNPPQRIWQGQWSDETWRGWSEAAAMPETIGGPALGLCEASSRCTALEAPQVIFLPTPRARVTVLELLPDGRFLIADSARQFFVLDEDGTLERREDLDGLPSQASTRDAAGQLWLGGRQGRLATGTIEAGLVAVDIPDYDFTIVAVSVSPNGERVLAVADKPDKIMQVLLRKNGVWSLIGEHAVFDFAWNRTSVVWTSNEDALLVHGGESIFEVRDEFLSEPDSTFEHPDALILHPEMGPILGAKFNPLFRRVDSAWREIPNSNLGRSVYSLLARPGGVYIGGDLGVFWELDFRNPGACESHAVASSDVEFIVKNEAGTFVLAGAPPGDGEAPVTILRLSP